MEEENRKKLNEAQNCFVDIIIFARTLNIKLIDITHDYNDQFIKERSEQLLAEFQQLAEYSFTSFDSSIDKVIKFAQFIFRILNQLQLQQQSQQILQLKKEKEYEKATTSLERLKQLAQQLKTNESMRSMMNILWCEEYARAFTYFLFQTYKYLEFLQETQNSKKELEENYRKAEALIKQSKEVASDIENRKQEIETLKIVVIKLGLAKRYTQEKERNLKEKWIWTSFAGAGLAGLFFFNYIPIDFMQATQEPSLAQAQSFSDYALSFFKKAPVYLALIWFILFASRRRNEAHRLASDYAHKEVFASSYIAYQDEIKKLHEDNKDNKEKQAELTELNIKLLDSMIGVLSDNPAKSLDNRKPADELPAKELIDFASSIIKLRGDKS